MLSKHLHIKSVYEASVAKDHEEQKRETSLDSANVLLLSLT